MFVSVPSFSYTAFRECAPSTGCGCDPFEIEVRGKTGEGGPADIIV